MSIHAFSPDELPSWEDFKSWCMERLKLNPHEHFIDCIDRVTLDWAGSVKDRVEVHSLDGTPTHVALPTLEE